jgi:hypothetical protein
VRLLLCKKVGDHEGDALGRFVVAFQVTDHVVQLPSFGNWIAGSADHSRREGVRCRMPDFHRRSAASFNRGAPVAEHDISFPVQGVPATSPGSGLRTAGRKRRSFLPWPGDRPPADGTDPFAERRATMGRCMSLASPRCLDRCRWLARAHRAARCPGGRSPAPRGSPRADGGYPRQPSTSEQTARRWSLVA